MEPAASIIDRLGGPTRVAEIVGIHRTRVSNWKRPRAAGGTDGRIPQSYHVTLLAFAQQNRIPLQASDFLHVAENAAAHAS